MIAWMMYWIWWALWRSAITIACVLTIQHIIHEQDRVWIDTQSMMIGAACLVLVIRIWSMSGDSKENK